MPAPEVKGTGVVFIFHHANLSDKKFDPGTFCFGHSYLGGVSPDEFEVAHRKRKSGVH
jgi:hypothetical protein